METRRRSGRILEKKGPEVQEVRRPGRVERRVVGGGVSITAIGRPTLPGRNTFLEFSDIGEILSKLKN